MAFKVAYTHMAMNTEDQTMHKAQLLKNYKIDHVVHIPSTF